MRANSERIKNYFQFVSMVLPAHSGPRPLIQFRNHFYTYGRTPWTNDQPVVRLIPKHRTTQTQNKRIHTPNIHALSGIRTHDPSVRGSEDSSCLKPRVYCDRQRKKIGLHNEELHNCYCSSNVIRLINWRGVSCGDITAYTGEIWDEYIIVIDETERRGPQERH
jgi:hypothetical protein